MLVYILGIELITKWVTKIDYVQQEWSLTEQLVLREKVKGIVTYGVDHRRGRTARLAQSVEHETLNLGVVGSSPTLGVFFSPRPITNAWIEL